MSDTMEVALVCMPFFVALRPSIQIGLLAAHASRAGFPVDSFHLNLNLAARMGTKTYDALCSHRRHMTGEWLFSYAAFANDSANEEEYFNAFPKELEWIRRELGKDVDDVAHLRREVLPAFIDECAALEWSRYRVVGFTSCFQQNVASLALARRIKEQHPQTLTLFGGSNFEDEMGPEWVRAFPCIDLAITGEADQSFPLLLDRLASGGALSDVPGLLRRCGSVRLLSPPTPQAAPVSNLDDLPTPDYTEYFARQADLGLGGETWSIPFESSRGCWWGKKHHCTFCGLNGLGMTFRAKTPSRVRAELAELAGRHRITFFEATDNILDATYVETFFDGLANERLDYQFFYEVKANLTKAQVKRLYEGGVRWLQPGIESLSTPVLRLMRKGATMLQNVQMLKWCRYYGIRLSWNLLWGFPGERPEHYEHELAVLKAISHLEPPGGCGRIWLERFSPYFFDRKSFPVERIEPEASYRYAYPGNVDLAKAAYFFDYSFADTLPDAAHQATGDVIKAWRSRAASPTPDSLVYRKTEHHVFVDDHRTGWPVGTHCLDGPLAALYLSCDDTSHTAGAAANYLRSIGHSADDDEVRTTLDGFVARGLMVSEGDRFLSLALPSQPNR